MPSGPASAQLHPVSGPGEDRNRELGEETGLVVDRCTRSPDRVRIATLVELIGPTVSHWLHPVSGPGEDRNLSANRQRAVLALAAPGLRTG